MTVDSEQPATAEVPSRDHMRRKNRRLTAMVIVLAAGVIALGGWLIYELSSESTSAIQRTGFPTGTFVVGTKAVDFNDDGTCRWYAHSGAWEFPCRYGVNGDLYTEMWFHWPGYSTEQLYPATYHWAFDGENLTFELWGHDANSSRRGTYSQVFVKSE